METIFNNIVIFLYSISFVYTAIAAIPQIYNLLKTKKAEELSLITFLGFNFIQIISAFHAYINHETAFLIGMILLMCAYLPITGLIVYYRYIRP